MDKPVVIEEYTPDWALQFKEEQRLLKSIMGDKAIAVEHIGSTSVEGLGAKPILDIMIGVRNLKEVDEFIESLEEVGYEHVFHKEFPNRRFFRKGLWRAGTHHLHVYKYESEEWNNNILFRNYLTTHLEVLQQYYQLKKELAEKYHSDRVAYTNAKVPFITNVIQKARSEINMTNFLYKLHKDHPIDPNSIKKLYNHVGWWAERSEENILKILDSSVAIGVWQEGNLIGFARAVTDYFFRAYIEDVVVHENVRKQGVGEEMLSALLLELSHIDVISLFCEDELISFYGKQKFKATKQVVMHRKKQS